MELEVVEVTVVVYGKLRHIEKRGEPLDLLRLDRMFNYHDGVIDIPTLDQIVLEQVLYLVEEHESTARADLLGIVRGLIPMRGLHAKYPGAEVHGDVHRRRVGRSDSHE